MAASYAEKKSLMVLTDLTSSSAAVTASYKGYFEGCGSNGVLVKGHKCVRQATVGEESKPGEKISMATHSVVYAPSRIGDYYRPAPRGGFYLLR